MNKLTNRWYLSQIFKSKTVADYLTNYKNWINFIRNRNEYVADKVVDGVQSGDVDKIVEGQKVAAETFLGR